MRRTTSPLRAHSAQSAQSAHAADSVHVETARRAHSAQVAPARDGAGHTGDVRPRRGRGRGTTNAVLLSLLTPGVFLAPLVVPSGSAAPEPVEPEVFSVPVAGVDPAAVAALGLPGAGPDAPELLSPEIPTEEFSTLGLSWERDADLGELEVHVRTRTDGEWTDWQDLHAEEADGPDLVEQPAAAPDAPAVAAAETTPTADVTVTTVERVSTPPLWAGPSDAVQVRVDTDGPLPRGVELELVDPGESPADAAVTQVPRGAASAAAARPTIVSRAQWGADESIRRGSPSYSDTIKAGFVHHTVNSNEYTRAQAPALVRSIYAYHVKSNGWSDVGYNFLVDRFGTVYEGRSGGVDKPVVGAHAAGFNSNTFGVAMIGDFTSEAPSSAALTGAQRVLAWKLSLHGLDPTAMTTLTSAGGGSSRYPAGQQVRFRTVAAHRDGNLTSCPGAQAYALMPQIRTAVKGLIGSRGSSPSTPSTPAPLAGAATPEEQIASLYARLGGGRSALGAPVTEVRVTPDGAGRFVHYQHGSIYWSAATGAHEIRGSIRQRWAEERWEAGALGYPRTDELTTADGVGRYNHFERGSIYWHPALGAHEVRGALKDAWAAVGWEKGVLGYPVTGHLTTPDGKGRYTHFQRGSVYWSPTTGAHAVYGSIREAWARRGWELGALGYPTSTEYAVAGGRATDFQGGRLVFNAATGAVTMTRR